MTFSPQFTAINGNGLGYFWRLSERVILPGIASGCNRSAPQLLHHKKRKPRVLGARASRRFGHPSQSILACSREARGMRIICRARGVILRRRWDRSGATLADASHMNAYRVRLRVVEEYDVALLADSPADAKARAEAEVRSGGEFEAIQDSWPEEIVSVEALAVEPYPDLE